MKNILLILTSSIFFVSACNPLTNKKEDNNSSLSILAIVAGSGSAVTEIPFQLVVGSETSYECNKLVAGHSEKHISESSNFYLKDARLYVHDVKLVKADGTTTDFTLSNDGVWQNGTVALLDFENATGDCVGGTTATNTSLKGFGTAGNYIGVEFKVGVPTALNNLTATSASAPLNSTAMYWSWTSGYKFLKLEWKTTDGVGATGTFHLGGVTCTGSGVTSNLSCSLPNIPTVRVTTTGAVTWSPTAKPVYLDVKALVNGTNTNVAAGGASLTCMSGNATAACKKLLNNVGVNEADGKTLTTQSAFYLKP
ncbi:metallo-mystery pair system four-Cys motif protein [Leptospira ognonensis]|uniref:Metallo-mystery pair system four-Cys motif protein n=1 Tax=Leptospira ognonensis TaxID=2484945 RepID=A0A4V6QM61_9LEPT|nr:MbnP family copper-binding protein [Leptospira ognonensis]TGL60185.1 metallo-mystery pair system four-Cys motif protein [Leptospira ognonensis]